MAKGWEHFSTVNDAKVESVESKKERNKYIDRITRRTTSLKEEELKQVSNERYAIKVAQEDNLIAAYEDKRLKSKRLIKQARYIKKMREAALKKTEGTDQPAVDPVPAQ